MPRIRTVKPDFWEDDAIGALSRDARLLFIATWNLADDEGLLRWSAPYLKASVFMYDEDITAEAVDSLMLELADAELVFCYQAGKARQRLAYIVNFRKHQKINRPQPSKLTPPSIQSGDTLQMYVRRDKSVCHLCLGEVTTEHDKPKLWPSLDHLVPRSQGGGDHPSNIALSHVSCNKARQDRPVEEFRESLSERSVNASVSDSLPEGKGKEGKGKDRCSGSGAESRAHASPPQPVDNHLPGEVDILRAKLEARKLTVRWDKLTDDQLQEIVDLIHTHGDAALVKSAVAAFQPDNPVVFAQAWLSHWRQLRQPGQLGLVEPLCPVHSFQREPASSCKFCASDRLAGER